MHELAGNNEDLLCVSNSSLVCSNVANAFFRLLNSEQKVIFNKFHELISSERPTVQLLDSEPGTGKTFLIGALSNTVQIPPIYCVYKTELAGKMKNLNFNSYTVTAHTMKAFNVSYYTAFNKYPPQKKITPEYVLLKLIMIVRKSTKLKHANLIILDEYTILNPEQLLAYCLYGLYNGTHLFFAGDRCQQNSITESSQHLKMSNYFLLDILSNATHTLTIPMRCQDMDYNLKLKRFRSLVVRSNGHTKLNFSYIYNLYQMFRSKFFTEEDFNSTYFAAYHVYLTERAKRLLRYLTESGVAFKREAWSESTNVISSDKFARELYLIPGYKYIYIKKYHGLMPYGQVELISFDDDSIKVRHERNGKCYTITKEKINRGDILESFYLNFVNDGNLFQYALWPLYVSTFHNAQGLTISNDIEINLTNATCESAYVGLSRIQCGDQLKKIHVVNNILDSLMLTEYMNDEYYYRGARVSSEEIKKPRMSYDEVFTITDFEDKIYRESKNLKIKKTVYDECFSFEDTVLMKVCKIIKDNPNNILDHLFKLSGLMHLDPFSMDLDEDHSICNNIKERIGL